jgi:hypothetical protein
LWYMANCLSYLGFYMPFINLVSEKLWWDMKHNCPMFNGFMREANICLD